MPTFTNPNNVSIVTGVSAARNGIAGNHYLDGAGGEVQVTDPSFLRATTIHAAALQAGVAALCVTAKDKLRRLLAAGGVPAFSAELRPRADARPTARRSPRSSAAPNPGIYDWELSPYTIDLALALADRLGASLVYASLTDFVQHSAAPGEALADDFYRAVDAALGRALDAGFAVGLVADHGMRAKAGADGSPTCATSTTRWPRPASRGAQTLCPITDPYVVHHAALGSLAWVHLDDLARARPRARRAGGAARRRGRCSTATPPPRPSSCRPTGSATSSCSATRTRCSAARATPTTSARSTAPLRSHGGLHERAVPLIVCAPAARGRARAAATCATATSTTCC